jgi:hypothetical protein
MDKEVTDFFVLRTKGHDEFFRHRLVQHECVHNTMSFPCLLCITADWNNRQNDISVDKCLEGFISQNLVQAFMMSCISFSQPSPGYDILPEGMIHWEYT